MSELPTKRDRDEVFVEYTRSVCPVCKVVVDAQVNIRDGKVYLRKRCREHGWFEALVYGDAQMYMDAARFNKPGTIPLTFQTEVRDGCPLDCGLCPEHKQHACLGIIEVNTGCNLDCPICFADSGHQPDGYSITVEQCATMLDAFVASEGEAEVVMFSGGEPTIHRDLLEFIDLAQARPIRSVTVNTNGIRLASDEAFVHALGDRNRPGRTVNIYLQFDGLDERTHLDIRGRDLRDIKQRALNNCADAGLTVTLVAAIERGINEREIGPVVEYGLAHPAVRGVAFQPVTHSGRHVEFDPLTRLTNSDVIHLLAQQRPDWFLPSDFFPVPCCFPTCRSVTYLLTKGVPGEPDFGLVPIPRLLDVEDYLDYVSNRVVPDFAIREALEKLWSASAFMGTDTTSTRLGEATAPLTAAAEALACADACGVNLPDALANLTDRAFMIVIQDFQDPYTLNVKQLMKCCVEEITPDGRLIPFCAYNSVGYREQVREQLSGVPVADVVPNARPLQRVLADSVYGSKVARNLARRTGRLRECTRSDQRAAAGPMSTSASDPLPACCADVYGSDLVALLLGDSYHPGGLTLTRRLASLLGVRRDEHVLDLACGRGSTALLLAEEFGARVNGLDLSAANVALAQGRLTTAGKADRVSFALADAEQLPHPDATFDAVVIECALCTFTDQARAVTEIMRVLRPGGRLGLTDVVAEPDQLPSELTSVAARIACVAGALTMRGYCDLLETAGMQVRRIERHDLAFLRMLDQIDARLALARLTARTQAAQSGLNLDRAGPVLTAARAAAAAGTIGYGLLIAEKPA